MYIVKKCKVVDESGEKVVDVRIESGKILEISSNIEGSKSYEMLDADGLYLLPSIVDLNIRIKDDAFNIPNLKSLHDKARKSGVSSFVLSPRCTPRIESQTLMELLLGEAENYPALIYSIKGLKESELNEIATLLKYGINIIQEKSSVDNNLIRRIMQYVKMKVATFFTFCQDPILNDGGIMNEGEYSFKLGIAGISKVGEISEVAKMVQMSKFFDVKTHFQALSTKESVDLIKDINDDKFSTEVSIHHLILDDSSCDGFNTYAKLDPPLRSESDKDELLEALKGGKIDTITSLHAQKSIIYKDVPFADAKFGINSLEDFMQLCYTFLVKEGVITMYELTELISKNPARVIGLENVGEIKEGYRADVMLFNPDVEFIKEDSHSPYDGKTFFGEIVRNIYSTDIS
jgi:dihydroorotase